MAYLKREHGVTHGYANGIVLQYRSRGTSMSDDDLVDAQYEGPKASLAGGLAEGAYDLA